MKGLIRRRLRARGGPRPMLRRLPSSGALALRETAKHNLAPKSDLTIGGVHDPAEKAADAMADHVLRADGPVAHRKCDACEGEDKTARRAGDGGGGGRGSATAASPATAKAVASLGQGAPLAKAERAFFEPRFNADLSSVRVHEGAAADRAARAMNARAFALGSDIALASGETRNGEQGRRLMAHELAHVLQGEGPVRRSCNDGKCESCAGGEKTLQLTVFYRSDQNEKTKTALDTDIKRSKKVLKNCCLKLEFDYKKIPVPGAKTVHPFDFKPDKSWNYSKDASDLGTGDTFKDAKGVPLLVVDEVTDSGGGVTINKAFDAAYKGRIFAIFAVKKTNFDCPTIAHELSHVGGTLAHSEADSGKIGACTGDTVNANFCAKVRALVAAPAAAPAKQPAPAK